MSGLPLQTSRPGRATGLRARTARAPDPASDAGLCRARRGILRAVLVTARPRQWVKNGLVIAAAGAAGALGRDAVLVRVLLACAAFCLISGGVYAINDMRDAAEDRLHPRKRLRPVAAGELRPPLALALGVALLALGVAICATVSLLLALVASGYIALSVSYALLWRSIMICDLAAIAGGFVLRAIAGGVAAPVTLSIWFLIVISACAV